MLTLAVAGLLTTGVTTGAVAPASALTDSQPPVVRDVSLTPSFVNVASGPGAVTVVLRITDDLSGLSHGYLAWRSPSGKIAQYASFVPGMLSSGTVQDGVYLSSLTLPRFSEPGQWKPAYLFVRDVTGNVSRLGTAAALADVPTLLVIDDDADPPAPKPRPLVEAGDGSLTVRWVPVRYRWPIDGYTVVVMPGNRGFYKSAPTGPGMVSATIPELTNGVGYTVTVRSNLLCCMSPSSPVSAVVRPRPTVSITGGSVTEGDAGQAMLPFTVALSAPSVLPVSVTATTEPTGAGEGTDYAPVRVELSFEPGEVTKTVLVPVVGDGVYERTEDVRVGLSDVRNAALDARTWATGTILDDDPQPTATITGGSAVEGDSGQQKATFTVTLSTASGAPAGFAWTTVNDDSGSARPGGDFVKSSGWFVIAPGRTTGTFSVPVVGDTRVEGDQWFRVRLSRVTGVGLTSTLLTGTIIDDDPAG